MKINKITYQHRRDFQAIYECEGCGHRVEGGGYDDANFHQNVVPSMRCPECGKTSAECGVDYRPLTTKYPEGYQISNYKVIGSALIAGSLSDEKGL